MRKADQVARALSAEQGGAQPFPFGSFDALRQNFLARARHSSLVRRQLERSSMTAEEAVSAPERWLELSPVTKADMLADQELDPPYGARRCASSAELGLVVESSGSTGKGREVHYLTHRDTAHTAAAWARYLAAMGVTPWDVVALCFPIGMAGGGIRHMLAYSELGATVLRIGGLSSERKIEAMRHYGASTLVATPAYVDHLGIVAEELGFKPSQLGIRRIVVATQSVSVEWVRSTEEVWGARLYEWYGTSAGIAAFACERGMSDGSVHGTLHWNPEIAVQEVVDPATGRHVEDGERGEMVGTPLINEAEPLFRIATGDEVRFHAPGSCACGSSWPGIESGTVRRLDTMFKVKGVNLWPATVDALVLACDEVLDYRARIWQDERGRERLALQLLAPAAGAAEELVEPLAAQLHEDSGLSFEVTVVGEREAWSQEIAGEAGKATRWIDDRAAGA
jgi:phenylacetate-CoA ligase